MKTHTFFRVVTALIVFGSWQGSLLAEETGVINQPRVNVRGQPSLVGEVITQLKKDEPVVILEEIKVAKPKAGEPAQWARIQMPPNTPVWVFASFLDPATKTVAVSKLNLRAGPGENYSVVGRLEKGAAVKEIRTVEDWMEIETPAGAYGFIALDLITRTGSKGTAPESAPAKTTVAAAPVESPAVTAPVKEPEPVPPPVTATPVTAEPAPAKVVDIPVKQEPLVAPVVVPAETPAVTAAVPAAPTPAILPPVTTKPAADLGPLPKRVVRREGIVRSTASVQAPTYYELISPETRKTINYLHPSKSEINIKPFRGKTVVVVGEEGIDSRWPTTPVIEIETIEIAP